MRSILLALSLISASSFAAPLKEVRLPDDGWYQIQLHGETLCETGQVEPCLLAPGIYTRINHTIGERDRDYEVVATLTVNQSVQTVVLDDRLARIIEMYCPDSDKAAVSITCAAYVRDENNNKRIMPVNGFLSAPAYMGTDDRADYDGACITDEPAFITATMFCALISSYERIDDAP